MRAHSKRNLLIEKQASDYAPVVPLDINEDRDREEGIVTLTTIPTTNGISFNS